MKNLNVTLIIPSLDPDDKLAATVKSAVEAGFSDVILVDDGSGDDHKKYFYELAELPEVTLLTHDVNRGKGAALKTAFAYYLQNRPQSVGVITADGDGQHRTTDIVACAEAMLEHGDIILGCRDFSLSHVPSRSRFGNRATSAVFALFFGMKLSDTQTGLRAIPREYVLRLSEANGSRYEYETNMLLMMSTDSIPFREVKIETVYYDNNEKSHFRPVRDSLRVYGLMIKYAVSSISSSVVDLLAFYLFSKLVFTGTVGADVLYATVAARIISVIFNFALNKKLVFQSKGGVIKTLGRYICLAVPILLASWGLVYLLSNVLTIDNALIRTLIKLPVDTLLFLVSFRVQRKWVFSDKK